MARRSLGRTLALSIAATTATSGLMATAAGASSAAPRVHPGSARPAVLTDITAATTTYTVQWGDTLSAIAVRFGSSVAALAAANGIADPNLIFAGQVLTVPISTGQAAGPAAPAATAAPTGYTVQWGDTLSAIAVRFGSSVAALAAANGIANPNLIFAGQVLTIPSSTSVALPAATASPAATTAVTSVATSATLFSTLTSSAQGTFDCIIQAESSGNPQAYNAASGAMGLLQFIESTWLAYGGGAYGSTPLQATARDQTNIGVRTYEADGFAPWAGDGCV